MAGTFPNKLLSFAEIDYQSLINSCLQDSGINDYKNDKYSQGEKLFLPRFVTDANATACIEIKNDARGENNVLLNSVWHVKCPGFIYRLHYRGVWSNSPKIRILVCRNKDFNPSISPIFELLDTTGSNGNNQSNCMFPIRPGANTYMTIVTDQDPSRQTCLFLPAHGFQELSASDICERVGDISTPSNVSYPGSPDMSEFIKIFE